MKKLAIFSIILISLACLFGCTSNGEEDKESYEDYVNVALGSGLPSGGCALPSDFCAYKSDTSVFDVDDVTLTFYYGGHFSSDLEYEKAHGGRDYPYFEVYFNEEDSPKILVKRVDEEWISEKYRCNMIFDKKFNLKDIQYNYSEVLTIPEEIFTNDSGIIYFSICGKNMVDPDQKIEFITGIGLFYKKLDGKIILSNKEFK